MSPTPKAIAEARAVLRANRKARKADRPKKIDHKPMEGKAFRGRDKDADHLAQIRQLPCIATLIRHGVERYGVEACHVRTAYPVVGWGGNPGLSVKPSDWRTAPLLPVEHRLQHSGNEQAYWTELGVYPPSLCAALRLVSSVELKLDVIRQYAAAAVIKRGLDSSEAVRIPARRGKR